MSDDAVYILQAELYSPWNNTESPAVTFIQQFSNFPPLYSMLLALFGADSHNPVIASRVTIFSLLISLIILGFYSQTLINQKVTAAFIPIIVAFNPFTLLLSQGIWSEFLFMCITYSVMILMHGNEQNHKQLLLASLLIALATLTRSIGITLVGGFVIYLYRTKSKKSFVYLIICATPFVLWMINRSIFTSSSGYLSVLYKNFNIDIIYNLHNLFLKKIIEIAKAWVYLFTGEHKNNNYINLLLFILSGISFITFLARLKQLKFDAAFVFLYLCMVIIWPFSGVYFLSRFLYPIYPIFLIYIFVSIHSFYSDKYTKKTVSVFYVILIFSLLSVYTPVSAHYIRRGFTNTAPEIMPYTKTRSWLLTPSEKTAIDLAHKHKAVILTLPKISDYVPPNECIYAIQSPFIMLHTHRIVIPFFEHANSPDKFKEQTMACNYFIALPMSGPDPEYPPYYPIQITNNNPGYIIEPLFYNNGNRNEPVLFLIKKVSDNN